MKIYRLIKIDIETGQVLDEQSYEYHGPLALCDGGESEGEGEGEGEFGGPDPPGIGGIGAEGPAGFGGGGFGSEGEAGPGMFGGWGEAGAGIFGGPEPPGLGQVGAEGPAGFGGGSDTGAGGAEPPGIGEVGPEGPVGMGFESEIAGMAGTKSRALEATAAPREVSWSNVMSDALRAATLGMIFGGPPGAMLAGVAGAVVSHESQAGMLGAPDFGGFFGEPTSTPTADVGETTGGGEGGQRESSRASAAAPSESAAAPGLLDSGEPLDEEEETLGRGRRATQTLLTGGQGLLAPARTRRRTLLAA